MKKHPIQFASNLLLSFVLPAALIAAGTGMFFALGKSEPKQRLEHSSDLAEKVSRLSIVETRSAEQFEGQALLNVDLNGVVVPFRDVTLAAEIAGRIAFKSERTRAGRFVNAGEVLFRLDARDYQLEVDRITHLRDQEYSQLREWEQEVANTNRSLKIAGEELLLHEQEIKRLQSLPSGFVSQTELDQARRARLATANQQQTLRNQVDLLHARRNRVELAQHLVATQLEQAKLNLARTEIKAPISGLIISENAESDSYVQRGTTLCQIEDTEKVEVRCNLRMDQLMLILDQQKSTEPVGLPGQSTSYELPQTPVSIFYRVAGREDLVVQWKGKLNRYEGIGLDPQSRTVPCRVQVDDPRSFTVNGKPSSEGASSPPALVRGMFVDVKIHTKPSRPLLLLPKLSLRPGNQVWKFVEDSSVLDQNDTGPESAGSITHDPVAAKTTVKTKVADANTPRLLSSATSPVMNPEDWLCGRIEVLRGIHVIRLVEVRQDSPMSTEFWVVESRDDLGPGDKFVVTPLTNIGGHGTDAVRVRKQTSAQ